MRPWIADAAQLDGSQVALVAKAFQLVLRQGDENSALDVAISCHLYKLGLSRKASQPFNTNQYKTRLPSCAGLFPYKVDSKKVSDSQ